MTDSRESTNQKADLSTQRNDDEKGQEKTDKPVYEKPKLKKYGQIDHIAAYGAE